MHIIYLIYVGAYLPLYVYVPYVQRPEDDFRSPGSGITAT